jgi:hypothetical protein
MSRDAAADAALLEAELRSLDRTLGALPEAVMQRQRLLEWLEEAGGADAYELVAAVVSRPGGAAPQLVNLREILQGLLRDGGASRPLEPELCAAVLAEARARDDTFVMRLFRPTPAAEAMAEPASALPRDLAELPLGVRRSLARSVDLDLLEGLLRDADGVVIDHLLQNPRITEAHVVRIASRRPVPSETLERIAHSRRFGQRTAVRTALARNPYLPTRLAVQLLGALPLAEVRAMAHDGTLHEETQHHARQELARRRTPG